MDFQQLAQFPVRLLAGTPDWVVAIADIAVCLVLALVLHAAAYRALAHLTRSARDTRRRILARIKGPTRLTALVIALNVGTSVAPLTHTQTDFVQRILLLCIITLVAWITSAALNIWLTYHLQRFRLGAKDDFLARKHVTQTHILQRVAGFLIWFTAISAGLMTFDSVRQYGVSLLASAGAAGIIVGIALQPVLKNLIAGIQIAITQPIKIGDSLIVEGDFGTVEDIKATYVVVRTWDLRRLVVPLAYFIEQPFQNWTRESTNLLGAAMLYLDSATPIETLRAKAREVVEGSPLWDRNVFTLQVTDFRERTIEIRVLVSAADGGKLFDLRCLLREKLIAFLKAEHPEALPRTRATLEGEPTRGTGQPTNTAGAPLNEPPGAA